MHERTESSGTEAPGDNGRHRRNPELRCPRIRCVRAENRGSVNNPLIHSVLQHLELTGDTSRAKRLANAMAKQVDTTWLLGHLRLRRAVGDEKGIELIRDQTTLELERLSDHELILLWLDASGRVPPDRLDLLPEQRRARICTMLLDEAVRGPLETAREKIELYRWCTPLEDFRSKERALERREFSDQVEHEAWDSLQRWLAVGERVKHVQARCELNGLGPVELPLPRRVIPFQTLENLLRENPVSRGELCAYYDYGHESLAVDRMVYVLSNAEGKTEDRYRADTVSTDFLDTIQRHYLVYLLIKNDFLRVESLIPRWFAPESRDRKRMEETLTRARQGWPVARYADAFNAARLQRQIETEPKTGACTFLDDFVTSNERGLQSTSHAYPARKRRDARRGLITDNRNTIREACLEKITDPCKRLRLMVHLVNYSEWSEKFASSVRDDALAQPRGCWLHVAAPLAQAALRAQAIPAYLGLLGDIFGGRKSHTGLRETELRWPMLDTIRLGVFTAFQKDPALLDGL
ncbi:MAG: hypothetical protein AAFQ82_10045, partial [Myxococcota bacterium]